MIKNILSLLCLIIFCFFNCARQAVKKTITNENISENIVLWQNRVSQKSGTGEMTVSEPDKRFSSYFSFQYNVEDKSLSGELLGSFGMSIGTFYFSEDSISIRDKDGKQVKKEVLSLLEENPDVSLSRFLMWDIPISQHSDFSTLGSNSLRGRMAFIRHRFRNFRFNRFQTNPGCIAQKQ
ncbi:MAG: hypothetical protein P8Y62_02795 [candidate division WOR-3 bacterium]